MRVVRVKPAAKTLMQCVQLCFHVLNNSEELSSKLGEGESVPGDRCFPTLVVRTVAGEAAMNSEAFRIA